MGFWHVMLKEEDKSFLFFLQWFTPPPPPSFPFFLSNEKKRVQERLSGPGQDEIWLLTLMLLGSTDIKGLPNSSTCLFKKKKKDDQTAT